MLFFGGKVVPFFSFVTLLCTCGTLAEDCSIRKTSSKLFCYYSKATDVNSCQCTHVVLPLDADVKAIDAVRNRLTDVKVLLTVNSFSESLITLLNATRIDGLDLRLTKLTAKDDIPDFISTIRSKLDPNLILTLAVPARAELLAKYYDFKALSKHVDSFILETAFLGASGNVTFHPSRLSGLWDVQNTDSVVDLVSGLGAPLQKLVIAAPVQAFKFTLQDGGHTAPGSPALQLSTINRKELCDEMNKNKWILERDQDQAGPYIFRDKTWIAFEDPTSIDIKSKYARVRGLAGLALKDLSEDAPCAQALDSPNTISILEAAHSGLTKQSRASRGAVLQSLEREILGTQQRLLDTVQVSPYRITRVVDTEGKVHAIRQDTRTEFACSRQGYFVHPRSCGRFYRCVKFDQLSEEYSVFEFDCPVGLVFDGRVEVCVWPGSLSQASACAGSSEIAPVPQERFICPGETGYYADKENCRWFFACLDHGKSPLSAYEFRCPFGLVFDQERLLCEWPWLVPQCSSGFPEGTYEEYSYGGIGTGALAGSGYITTEDTGLSKTGLILGQYNGLGSLRSVSLGGLSGPLIQPVPKTYSSFSSLPGRDVDVDGNVLDYKPIGTAVIGHGHRARLNDFVDESQLINGDLGVNLYRINQQGDFDRLGNFASGGHINSQSQEGGVNLIRTQNLKLANSNLASATSFANLHSLHSAGDKINIIGGGFSAVGGTGVQLSQYGSNIGHATPLPIEGSSTIATVTSVPIPIVQNTAFDIYKTGVVANIPNLQYKVSPAVVNTFFNQGYQSTASTFNKHSLISGFNKNFVSSSTPIVPTFFDSTSKYSKSFVDGSPIVELQQQGYNNPKAFVEEEKPAFITTKEYNPPVFVTTIQPPVVVVTKDYLPPVSVATIQTPIIKPQEYLPPPKPITGQSYSYSHQNRIHTKIEEPIIQIQQSLGYEMPQTQVVQLEQRQPQFINTNENAYQQPTIIKAEGYSYPKPTIKFEDIPKINQAFSYSQVQQSSDGYNYPKPTITLEEKPTVLKIETQPQSYVFSKPTIPFEQNPSTVSFVQQNTIVKPQQPKLAIQEHVGYGYPKPSIQFVEEPLQQPQVVKIDQYPIKFQHKPAISSQSFTQQVFVEYDYPKPQIKFEEKPLLNQYIPPKVVQGYTYPKPAIKFVGKPIVTQYVQPKIQQQTFVFKKPQVTQYVNPLQPKVVSQGYSYQRPNIAFEEKSQHHTYVKPAQTQVVQIQPNFDYSYPKPTIKFEEIQQTYITAQPAVSSQVFTQLKPVETKIEVPQNYGYVPLQPAVKFVEKPVVVQQNYVTPQPIVQVQENIGYEYPKPTIKFVEKPIVVQHSFVTPKPVINIQENIDYEYPKPTIKFEEKPAVIHHSFVTPKPVINIQENIGYEYPKPTIKFVEKPIVVQHSFVTPKPVIHIEENVGYSYSKPSIKFEEKPAVIHHSFVTPKPVIHIQENIGYEYPKPTIKFEEKPAVIHHSFVTPKPVIHIEENVGYSYSKPSIKFEEKPAVIQHAFVTPKPVIHIQENIGYEYRKPTIKFEEKPAVIHHSFVTPKPVIHIEENVGYSYSKPSIKFEEKPAVIQHAFVTPKPVIHIEENVGYSYSKPSIKFEEKPAVIQHAFVTPKPVIHIQENIGYEYRKPTIKFEEKPAVIQHAFVTPTPVIHIQENIGYSYSKPSIKFEEKPAVIQPTFVTPRPAFYAQENIGYAYPKPAIKFEENYVQPVIQQTYIKPVQPIVHLQENNHQRYEYPKPAIRFEEQPVVVQQAVVTAKPPVVLVQQNVGYEYPKPAVKYQAQPVVIHQQTNYVKPVSSQSVSPVVQQNIGYAYTKPAIKFEEKPVSYNTYSYQNIAHKQQTPVIYEAKPIQPASLPTYTYQKPRAFQIQPIQHQQNYIYEKPVEQKIVQVQQSYHYQQKPAIHQVQVGYEYPQPQIKFEEQPIISYGSRQPVQEEIIVPKKAYVTGYQNNEGYVYNKPSVAFEEAPRVTPRPTYVSTVSSVVVPKIQQNYDSRFESRPQILLQEQPIVDQKTVVESKPIFKYEFSSLDNSFNSYVAPPQKEYLPQVVSTTQRYIEPPRPVQQYIASKPQEQKIGQVQQPALIQSYHYQQKPAVQQVQVGYEYPQPQTKFEEKPVISYENRQPVQEEIIVPKKAYVTGYQNNEGYVYDKPSVAFEEAPRVTPRPTYVSTIASVVVPKIQQNYDSRFESRPQILLQEQPIVDQKTVVESKPIFKYEFSSLDNSFNSYVAPPQKEYLPQVVSTTQRYIEPARPVQQYIASKPQEQKIGQVQQPALIQSYHYQQKPAVQQVQVGYEYPQPQIKFEEKPVISYENRQPVQEEIIVPKKAYVTGYQNNEGYVYDKPSVAFEEAPRVTPRPTYVSTIASVVVPKIQQNYDSRFESRPQVLLQEQPIVDQKTAVESKPIFKYEFSSLDNSFNSYVAPPQKEYLPQVVSTTQRYIEPARPVQQYIASKPQEQKTYVQSKPIAHYEFSSFDKEYKTYIAPPVVPVQKEYLTTPKFVENVEVKQIRPIAHYEFSSFDSRFEPQKVYVQVASTTPKYVSRAQFQINVPDLEYLPVRKVVIQPPKVYIPAITTEKVVVRTRKPPIIEKVITIPKRTYLPVTTEKVFVTKLDLPDREYLPVKTGKFIENYEAELGDEVATRRPAKVVKLVRPKSKSIIKVNDFHPILSTKLGAQCTCTSNTLQLRKPATKKISVQVEEPETRLSALEEYINNEEEIIIEDYQYEPQKIQDTTPHFILKSTTEELQSNAPAPNLVIKKRLRIRPSYKDLPVSKAADIFIGRSGRPKQIVVVDEDTVKLVKSAVKEGVKEGLRESAIESKILDRYGPGGVRSRSETLQGTIDCQRAGLFRHPNQCNKFYACRWDCKKNRFTLHVFNCPVHLTFDNNLGACNWPSQGPACVDNTLLPND